METVLETKSLSKTFGEVKALDAINLKINKGEWVSIMGPSGSGKTTLLNILSCLDKPSKGDYILRGVNTSKLDEKERVEIRRHKIGLIFQQFHLIPYLTALENVMLAQYYHSLPDKNQAIEILDQVKLSHRKSHLPSQLSGGEKQRVCIARALINNPDIVLADEPTGNLDEANEKIVVDLFRDLKDKGTTIIFVTHNPELGKITNRVLKLNHGKLEN